MRIVCGCIGIRLHGGQHEVQALVDRDRRRQYGMSQPLAGNDAQPAPPHSQASRHDGGIMWWLLYIIIRVGEVLIYPAGGEEAPHSP